MTVGELMCAEPVTVTEEMPLREAAHILATRRISCLVVTDADRRPIGMLTERDFVRVFAGDRAVDTLRVSAIMSRPVVAVSASLPLATALEVLEKRRVRRLVVVGDDGRIAGVLTQSDLIRVARRNLIDTITALARGGGHREASRDLAHRLTEPISAIVAASEIAAADPAVPEAERERFRRVGAEALHGGRELRRLLRRTERHTDRLLADLRRAEAKGRLGTRVMTTNVLVVPETTRLGSLALVMERKGISCVVVQRDRRPVGIITERDWVRFAADGTDLAGCTTADVMTRDVMTIEEGVSLLDVIELMDQRRIRRLPVVDGQGFLRGLITQSDILASSRAEVGTVREKLLALRQARRRFVRDLARLLTDRVHRIGEVARQFDAKKGVAWRIVGRNARFLSRALGRVGTLDRIIRADDDVMAPVDLVSVVADRVGAMRVAAGRAGVGISVVAEPGLPVVIGERGHLETLVANLVSNAVRYTPAGRTVRVSLAREASVLCLRVEDAGHGVAPEHHAYLFEEGFRGTRPLHGEPGVGLGLATCRAVAERHGGDIGVEPRPGGGSRFWVRIPVPVGDVAGAKVVA